MNVGRVDPAEPLCEGLAPFCCGNPSCPAHGCDHEWTCRPESDTYECLICGDER